MRLSARFPKTHRRNFADALVHFSMALAVAEKVAGVPDHVGVGVAGDKFVFCEIFQNTFRYFVRLLFPAVDS